MAYVFTFVMGLMAGSVCIFLFLLEKQRRLRNQKEKQDVQMRTIQA